MSDDSASRTGIPSRPRLVLRLGFAGNRSLPDDPDNKIETAIRQMLDFIALKLEEFAPAISCPPPPELSCRIGCFYSNDDPEIRLISGLAEGADALIAREFLARRKAGRNWRFCRPI